MDALIRFCFSGVDPQQFESIEEYAKMYGQAKYIWDNITVSSAVMALKSIA
jgi:hypothetical protein